MARAARRSGRGGRLAMAAPWLATLLVSSPGLAEPDPQSSSTRRGRPGDSAALVPAASNTRGLLGLGVGVEVPMVGVASGAAELSSVGWGFVAGAGVSYDLWHRISLRLSVATLQTYAGRATVRYSEAGQRVSQRQFADWNGLTVGVQTSYLFAVNGPVVPYAGVGAGVGYGGFLYHFDQSLDKLEPVDIDAVPQANTHPALGLAWSAQALGGVRLILAPSLAAQLELTFQHAWLGQRPILNTREPRAVDAPAERVGLLTGGFSIRVLL